MGKEFYHIEKPIIFCCPSMEESLENHRLYIDYDEEAEQYFLVIGWPNDDQRKLIFHCPWCGSTLNTKVKK